MKENEEKKETQVRPLKARDARVSKAQRLTLGLIKKAKVRLLARKS